MADRITAGQLMAPFLALYRSVDIRVAAVFEEERWANALTVIRLSRLPSESIEHRQRMLVEKWGELQLKSFRIDMAVLGIDRWKDLVDSIRNGTLPLPELDIAFPQPVDLSAIEIGGYGVKEDEEWPHRVGIATRGQSLRWEQHDSDVIKGKDYLSTLNALNTLLGLENFTRNDSTQVFLSVPVYAAIRGYSFAASSCEFVAEFDGSLSDLMVSVYSTIGDSHTLRDRQNAELSTTPGNDIGDGVRRTTVTVPLDTREHDILNLRLIHTPTAYEIESHTQVLRYYSPPGGPVDPLLAIFSSFCDFDTLATYLTQPTDVLAKSAGVSGGAGRLFEVAVSWLITLLGFRSLGLGGTNHERFKGSSMMTVDLLGASVPYKSLLLAGCTITDPPPPDFDKLIRTRDEVAKILRGKDITIIPVIFTALRVAVAKDTGKRYGVRVIDADGLRSLIDKLKVFDPAGGIGQQLDIWEDITEIAR